MTLMLANSSLDTYSLFTMEPAAANPSVYNERASSKSSFTVEHCTRNTIVYNGVSHGRIRLKCDLTRQNSSEV